MNIFVGIWRGIEKFNISLFAGGINILFRNVFWFVAFEYWLKANGKVCYQRDTSLSVSELFH